VYPAIYEVWKWHFELKRNRAWKAEPEVLEPYSYAVADAEK
jgi:hypothetical protein